MADTFVWEDEEEDRMCSISPCVRYERPQWLLMRRKAGRRDNWDYRNRRGELEDCSLRELQEFAETLAIEPQILWDWAEVQKKQKLKES